MRKKIQKKVISFFSLTTALRVLFYGSFVFNGMLAFFLMRDYVHVHQRLNAIQAIHHQYDHQAAQLSNIVQDFHRRFDVAHFSQENDEDVYDDFLLLNRNPEHIDSTLLVHLEASVHSEEPEARASRRKRKETALFAWPIMQDDFWISSYFGFIKKRNRFHAGIDMAAHLGTPVYAAGEGKIEFADSAGTFGSMILISHNRQYKTRYAHLSKILVNEGEPVTRGQIIGLVGNTGRTSGKNGYHLHFEVLSFDKAVNPMNFLA